MTINRLMADLINVSGEVKLEYLDEAPRGLDSAGVNSIASSSLLKVYDSLGELPITNLQAGSEAFIKSTNRLYLTNGAGWYNVAMTNLPPIVTLSSNLITLATDGTPSIVTVNVLDSDTPTSALTITAESDGTFFGMATLSQDSSIFTITPLGIDSAIVTSSTITFRISDGTNIVTDSATFNLNF